MRDVYEIGDQLLIVTTDRISAFDYVLGSGIPDKGKVLTQLSGFWFERMGDLVPHHLVSMDVGEFPEPARAHADVLRGRTMLVRRTEPVPIECVARGYLSGSGWKEYQQTGSVCGVRLPAGLRESDRLPEPIFTPATKAESGHDENISEDEAGRLVGDASSWRGSRRLTLEIYRRGAAHAESKGIIIADTKFEFGLVGAGDPTSGRRADRRSAHARLVAVLAGVAVRARSRPAELRQAVRARLSRRDPLEQAAAGAVPARRRRPPHPGEVRRSLHPAVRPRAAVADVRDQLDELVQEMLDKGILYDDARREFEKMFIARALQRSKGSVGDAADLLGLHRNTVARKMAEYRIRRAVSSAAGRSRPAGSSTRSRA